MNIYKIKNISKLKDVNNNAKTDFSKFKININKIQEIKRNLNDILNIFDKYKDYFKQLPIKFHFSKLLAKYQRFSIFLKEKLSQKLIQIDSKYLFDEFNKLKDELKIVYSVSKNDILNTLKIISKVEEFCNTNLKIINEINSKNSSDKIETLFKSCKFKDKSKTAIQNFLFDILYIKNFNVCNFN